MDWKAFFDRLGMNGTRWQWRIMRWQQQREARRDRATQRAPQISERHKFCTQCGALLERDDTDCIRCGAKAQSWQKQKVRRQMAVLIPSTNPASSVLFLFIAVLGVVQMIPRWGDALTMAGVWNLALTIGDGSWWRVLSYGLLHGGIMHLGFNIIALSQVGPMVEEAIGGARFYVVYTLTVIAAAAGFAVVNPMTPMLGASGGLFGLIGFGLSYAHFYGGPAGRAQRNFFLQWAMYGLVFGIVATFGGGMAIANSAHVGGLLAGLVLGWVVERERRLAGRLNKAWRSLAGLCWLATVAACVLMVWTALR